MKRRLRSDSQSGARFRRRSPVVVRHRGEAAGGEPESADDPSAEKAAFGVATKAKWRSETGDINEWHVRPLECPSIAGETESALRPPAVRGVAIRQVHTPERTAGNRDAVDQLGGSARAFAAAGQSGRGGFGMLGGNGCVPMCDRQACALVRERKSATCKNANEYAGPRKDVQVRGRFKSCRGHHPSEFDPA